MEGPNVSRLPRTLFSCPVEVKTGGTRIHRDNVQGNLSLRGLFLSGEHLPVDGVVHQMLFGAHRLEAEGIVRHCGAKGAGIEFRSLSEEQTHLIHEFIAEFTPGELLAR